MEFDNHIFIIHVFSHMTNSDFATLSLISSDMHSLISRLREDNYLHFLRVCLHWTHSSESTFHPSEARWREVYDCMESLFKRRWRGCPGRCEAEIALRLHLSNNPHSVRAVTTLACASGYTSVVSMVLGKYQLSDESLTHFLEVACEKSQCEVIKILLQDERMSRMHGSLLHDACHRPALEVAQLLLSDERWNPTSSGLKLCLMDAVSEGHEDILRLLLRDGRTDPNYGLFGNLQHLITDGQVGMIRLFLSDPRVIITAPDWDVLMIRACRLGHTEVVRLLLGDRRMTAQRPKAAISEEWIKEAWREGQTDVLRSLLADVRVSEETRKAYDPDNTWSYRTRVGAVIAVALSGAVVLGIYCARR